MHAEEPPWTFNDVLSQTLAMGLQQHGRVSYRGALKRQFALDDDYLADLTEALLLARPQIVDEGGRGLVWTCALWRPTGHRSPAHQVHRCLPQEPPRERARVYLRCPASPLTPNAAT